MRRIISPCTSGVVLLLVIGLMNRSDGFNTNNIHPWSIASSAHRSLSNHENHINNVNDDVSSRRKVLERGTAFISFLLLTDQSPANAFENKISNQYDDRPKQRGSQAKDLGVAKRQTLDGYDEYVGLKPCDARPHCFCSTMTLEDDPDHSIPPWIWPDSKSKERALEELYQVLAAYQPGQNNVDGGGFSIKTYDVTKGYIYVQFESLKNGYIDDFEAAYIPNGPGGERAIQIRYSSRLGYFDYGVNAKRLNYIAERLREKGWDAVGVDYQTHKGYAFDNNL